MFEPLIDDKMRQLKCLSPVGIGFRTAWQNSSGPDSNSSPALVEDCGCFLYADDPSSNGSLVSFSKPSLPSIDESDSALIGTITYTMVAILAYCNKTNLEPCISALSEVFCMDIRKARKLYADLASVPSVAHVYTRNLRPDMNPFYKQKAFENDNAMLDTAKYREYQETELLHTRTELLRVVNTLYLSFDIHRYKVTAASEPPHPAVGPAAKIEQRTFWFEAQVGSLLFTSTSLNRQTHIPL